MTSDTKQTGGLKDADAVLAAVASRGLLFLSDPKRPNAIEVLTGEFPRGSWWSHPQSNAIYAILQTVEGHPDVLLAKLLDGKVTLIHRALWPALLTVVTAREPWQTGDLSAVVSQGLEALDAAEAAGAELPAVSRTVSKELETRLLLHAESVHTDSGKHETRLAPWRAWAARAGCVVPAAGAPAQVVQAKKALEGAAAGLGAPPPTLPWQS
jgi:hypothetical protein